LRNDIFIASTIKITNFASHPLQSSSFGLF
jgi:hypothetical protein